MNWIKNFVRPKIRSILGTDKREVPENMWVKDPDSGQMVFDKDLEANQHVMPQSGYHMRMPPEVRLKAMFDDGAYEKIAMPTVPADPLKFRDERKYADRIKEARTKNGVDDCIQAGTGELDGFPVTIAVQDFAFMGGSLGMAAGEAIVTAMRKAAENKTPFIFFISSGGARMQEGVLSLMQMPRRNCAPRNSPTSWCSRTPPRVVSPLPMPCWATCISPSPARSSALPASASSSRPSARSCPTASSAPNTSRSMAWWTWWSTATRCARRCRAWCAC